MLLRRIFIFLLLLGNCILVFRLLVSDQGLFGYLEMRKRHEALQYELERAKQDNLQLSNEIQWLKKDRDYMEQTIRSQTNYLKENEILYLFPDDAGDKRAGERVDEE